MPAPAHQLIDVDGRRLDREQNREAVLDALVQLFHEGAYQPNANEIAELAGLSPRSLFRYFDDVDDLNRAAIERQLAAARPLLDLGVGPDAPTRAKIDHLVGRACGCSRPSRRRRAPLARAPTAIRWWPRSCETVVRTCDTNSPASSRLSSPTIAPRCSRQSMRCARSRPTS